MTLLQAAFSHNAFAKDWTGKPGGYRRLVDEHRVAGPVIITHTRNDKAVGIAYAIASSIAGPDLPPRRRQRQPLRRAGQQRRPAHARGNDQLTLHGEHDRYQFDPRRDPQPARRQVRHRPRRRAQRAVANAVLQNLLTATRA